MKGGAVKQIMQKDIKSHTHARVKLESSQKSSQAKSVYELKVYLVYYEARGVIVTSLLLLMR